MFYIDGSFLEEEQAKISILDLGLIRGYGVFDYMRTYKGRPFQLYDHLLRLRYSAEHVGLSLSRSFEEIETIIQTLLKNSGLEEAGIKILVTGGVSHDQLLPQNNPSLMIYVFPLKPLPKECYLNGIKTITTKLLRIVPQSKTLQYIPAIMALKKGLLTNAQEALYLNKNKEILEATTSNFFAFKNGVLITPESEEILLGITRAVMLKLAKEHFPIEIRPVSITEWADFDEVFLTSSNKEVLPVIQIDDHVIRTGKVGKNTQFLMQLFAAYTAQKEWDLLNIARYSMAGETR